MSILVVGAGKMGISHLAILSRLSSQRELALCDSSLLRRLLLGRLNYKTFSCLDDAFASNTQWVGAVIATPTTTHFGIAKSLLEKGIPCFIEKPLTLAPAKSEELVDLCLRHSIVAQMGFAARFFASFLRLRWISKSRALGNAISYQAHMLGNVITRADSNSWRTVFSRGGGCLNEYGPHLIDLCRFVFGDVRSVESAASRRIYSINADDAMKVSWEHESGCMGDLDLNWCDSSKRKATLDFSIEYELGTVRASNLNLEIVLKDGVTPPLGYDEHLLAPLSPHPVPYYLRGEEFTLQLEVFLESVTGRKVWRGEGLPADTAATISDGLEVDKLIQTISSRAGLS